MFFDTASFIRPFVLKRSTLWLILMFRLDLRVPQTPRKRFLYSKVFGSESRNFPDVY